MVHRGGPSMKPLAPGGSPMVHRGMPSARSGQRPSAMTYRGGGPRVMGKHPGGAGGAVRSGTSRGMRGLGDVSDNWKYATIGLIGLVGLQLWWWNKKAPNVLKLGRR